MHNVKSVGEIPIVRKQSEDLERKTLFEILNSLLKNKKYLNVTNEVRVSKWFGIKILEMTQDGSTGNIICINRIEMQEQGNGRGTALMELICEWADKNKVTLTLTPSTSFGATSTTRLIGFYKRFGFVLNKGRNSNFATRQAMYRIPK